MDTPSNPNPTHDTAAWRLQVVVAFLIALCLTTVGILYLPVDAWTKGYLAMGLYFTVSSAFGLAKTLRDAHESSRLIHRIAEARTEQMLREYGEAA
ncbi:MAG: YiaA/YiaB family inner membrane protein [Myxococcales bacterium]